MKVYWLMVLLLCNGISIAGRVPARIEIAALPEAQHVVWNKRPIAFDVAVGKERLLIFNAAIALNNVNEKLTNDNVRLMNNDGTLYVLAKKPFDPVRLSITLKQSGKAVLVDITSKAKAPLAPLVVLLPNTQKKPKDKKINATQGYPELARFALQQLFSPERLVHHKDTFVRVPMRTRSTVLLMPHTRVLAKPLVSWQAGSYYVTAVLLLNQSAHRLTINPNQLRGDWRAVSFYPSRTMAPAHSLKDRVTVVLISSRPFADALASRRGLSI